MGIAYLQGLEPKKKSQLFIGLIVALNLIEVGFVAYAVTTIVRAANTDTILSNGVAIGLILALLCAGAQSFLMFLRTRTLGVFKSDGFIYYNWIWPLASLAISVVGTYLTASNVIRIEKQYALKIPPVEKEKHPHDDKPPDIVQPPPLTY
jgi:hypothetical protein